MRIMSGLCFNAHSNDFLKRETASSNSRSPSGFKSFPHEPMSNAMNRGTCLFISRSFSFISFLASFAFLKADEIMSSRL